MFLIFATMQPQEVYRSTMKEWLDNKRIDKIQEVLNQQSALDVLPPARHEKIAQIRQNIDTIKSNLQAYKNALGSKTINNNINAPGVQEMLDHFKEMTAALQNCEEMAIRSTHYNLYEYAKQMKILEKIQTLGVTHDEFCKKIALQSFDILGQFTFDLINGVSPLENKYREKKEAFNLFHNQVLEEQSKISESKNIFVAYDKGQKLKKEIRLLALKLEDLARYLNDAMYEMDNFPAGDDVKNYMHYWYLQHDAKKKSKQLQLDAQNEALKKPNEEKLQKLEKAEKDRKEFAERTQKNIDIHLLKKKHLEEKITELKKNLQTAKAELKASLKKRQALTLLFSKEINRIDSSVAEVDNQNVSIEEMDEALKPFFNKLNLTKQIFKKKKGSHQKFLPNQYLNPISQKLENISFMLAPHTNQDRIDISTQARSIARHVKIQVSQRYDEKKSAIDKEINERHIERDILEAELKKFQK